jgi:hypothetical protein
MTTIAPRTDGGATSAIQTGMSTSSAKALQESATNFCKGWKTYPMPFKNLIAMNIPIFADPQSNAPVIITHTDA